MFKLIGAALAALLFAALAVLFAPLALLLRAARGGRFYLYRDTISAQVQACGLSLQVGHRLFGWAPPSWFSGRQGRYRPMRLILLQPETSARTWAQLLILGHGLSFQTQRRGASGYQWPGSGLVAV